MRCCAISSRITDMLNVSIPPPPYCSGAPSAQSPAALVFSDSRLKSSSGMPGASGSSRCSSGMISSRMKRRTCSRMSRSSSGRVKPGNVAIGRDDTIAAMSDEISRRVFIAASAALVVAPLPGEAQTPARVYVVGIISVGAPTSPAEPDWWKPFIDGMRELNYVQGRNLVLRRASAEGRGERLPGLARDLVLANVDVIVTTSTRETRAARQATSTIPIVMTFVPDPVGLVSSLARPGGNVTGLTNLVPGMRQKWVELLKEA